MHQYQCVQFMNLKVLLPSKWLFFTRNHGGTAHVDPNEWRLMIHGKVKKK